MSYRDEVLSIVVVGASGVYEARCRRCHEPNGAAVEAEQWLFSPPPERMADEGA